MGGMSKLRKNKAAGWGVGIGKKVNQPYNYNRLIRVGLTNKRSAKETYIYVTRCDQFTINHNTL